ncbi:hypothetical protein [Microlunatus speluncae]|uniref:hypothetical protein n=1 Tax=Microlunatus speluncae TaxID=2594267 RepID=UPI00126679FF|nr:hypothetical protein [Microlunatus speluncae]
MPTFQDPVEDAREGSEALRGLAHATRTFDDPADAYTVIGDLLGAVQSLRQVLDQVADTHLAHRDRAANDTGERDAGAVDALAAADFLHDAGGLIEQAGQVLDRAAQHAGRVAWLDPQPIQRWVSAVFLQGEEADQILEVIERDGDEAAIQRLSQWDHGDETTNAAMENGHVYDEPPNHGTDRQAIDGEYALTYNPASGHVALYRRHAVEPDSAVGTLAPPRRDPPRNCDSALLLRIPGVGTQDWPWVTRVDQAGGNPPRGVSR